MSDDRMKILEERLTRLEATLAQRGAGIGTGGGGFTAPGGVIADPAPWAAASWAFQHRAIPSPVVDPAPWPWYGGWGRPRWPTPIVDPGPFPTPVVDPAPWPSPVVDPAVFARSLAATLGRVGPIGDPPPPDFSRLSAEQLESTLHSIAAEKTRLDSMEALVKKQIASLKKQPG